MAGTLARTAALVLGLCLATAAGADESRFATSASDPCSFRRRQAYGKGVGHYATEVL